MGGVYCQLSLSRSSFLGLGGGVVCRVCIVMSDIIVLIAPSGGIPSLLRGSKVLSSLILYTLPSFHVVSLPFVSYIVYPVLAVVVRGGSLHTREDGGAVKDTGVVIGCPSSSRGKDGGGTGGGD